MGVLVYIVLSRCLVLSYVKINLFVVLFNIAMYIEGMNKYPISPSY